MFEFLTDFANILTSMMGIDLNSKLGGAVSFFIEDTIKIFLLIYIMLFVVSLFRSQLDPHKIKEYLSGKRSIIGYALAVILGVITPFCSCSSIPLFIGFMSAGVPFGMAMTFLIASPLISEVAAVLLLITPNAGVAAACAYIICGIIISILGGYLCDRLELQKFKLIRNDCENQHSHCHGSCCSCSQNDRVKSIVKYANDYSLNTLKEISLYILLGLIVGAFMHGYIPQELFVKYLGESNPFAVIVAAFAGIPIYANHNSVLPIVQVLLIKGVPIGTTLVMLMSITAISLPEMIMLHKVLSWKMLGIFASYLFVSFIIVGYFMNWILF